MENNKIAIITVVYNNYDILDEYFGSLQKQTNTNWELIIADLSDNRKPIKNNTIPYSLIEAKNKGYAHGVNVGLKAAIDAGLKQFVVMNSDVFFKKNFVEEISNSFEKHPHSLFGGKIYYAPNYEFHTDRYEKKDLGKVIWYAGGIVDWNHALTYHVGVDEVDTGQFNTAKETEFITGCLVCFDKNVIDEIGFWDENYFLYYEDSDYCERAKKAGLKLMYNPQIELWHKNAQSTGGSGSEMHHRFQERARVRFALKYAPLRTKLHIIKNYYLR